MGFSAADAVTGLKLVEEGVPKEQLALLAVPMVPLQILLPLVISKYTAGPRPLDIFYKAYPFRSGLLQGQKSSGGVGGQKKLTLVCSGLQVTHRTGVCSAGVVDPECETGRRIPGLLLCRGAPQLRSTSGLTFLPFTKIPSFN